MLGFACVRDCGRCPFAGCRKYNPRPPMGKEVSTQPREPTVEASEEETPAESPVDGFEPSNLPALPEEVGYEIVDSRPAKRGLFGWRKR